MSICEQCNTEITSEPMNKGVYGGDWISSCPICEWCSESEEDSKIKQGLTLEELVEHKAKLNSVYAKLHDLVFRARSAKGAYRQHSASHTPNKSFVNRTMSEEIMLELGEAMNQLLDKTEHPAVQAHGRAILRPR